jgi:hypothetical protein
MSDPTNKRMHQSIDTSTEVPVELIPGARERIGKRRAG